MRFRGILFQAILKHAFRLGKDHRLRGKPGVVETEIRLGFALQGLEIVEAALFDRDKDPIRLPKALQQPTHFSKSTYLGC